MTLQNEIRDLLASMAPDIPAEAAQVMASALKKLEDSGLVERALHKGDRLKPFTLPDLHGVMVSSIDLLEQGPLVINFYRGSW
jgi:hypothetical protein